ncbi:MAG: TauD/TfdA family dioxygenase, partial [Bryobacteraceae bacterium]
YPAHQHIALHNEFSYAYTWPMRIFFYALLPAEEGGETPIADSRKVYASLRPELRDQFAEKGILYVRNYGSGVDLTWQDAFQTAEKLAVEDYCRLAPLEWEWLPGDRLRTRQRRPAIAVHPVTRETVWFNQLISFTSQTSARKQPRQCVASSPRRIFRVTLTLATVLPSPMRTWLRSWCDRCRHGCFPWQARDILVLDNMLVAHGRNPYRGDRKILAALAQPYSLPGDDR